MGCSDLLANSHEQGIGGIRTMARCPLWSLCTDARSVAVALTVAILPKRAI